MGHLLFLMNFSHFNVTSSNCSAKLFLFHESVGFGILTAPVVTTKNICWMTPRFSLRCFICKTFFTWPWFHRTYNNLGRKILSIV